ncbi:MAG TPA: hypothetical protein VMG80_02260 [Solirubrobacteraceae bacterium]|nr:hypothetical protein [Solirubrobacteraceae bacterium]
MTVAPRRRSKVAPGLVLAVAASLAFPGPSLAGRSVSEAGSKDVAATRAYIDADLALVDSAKANLKTSERALRRLQRQIDGECAGAAIGSPQNRESEQLSNELIGAIAIAAIQPDRNAVTGFAHAVQGLRWSNGELTRKVAGYAAKLTMLARLAAPDFCGDVRAWTADGFRMLPPNSVSFNARYERVEVAVGEVPAKLLAPSERPAERPLLARVDRLEGELAEAEANAVYVWGHIMGSLALNR